MYAIEIEKVSKKYRLYHDYAPTLKEKFLFRHRSRHDEFWVLKDINLKIAKGETVGLIGQNGSGKSTLLKLMSRIIYPDKGNLKMAGRVSSLLELGAGFHPDFTGLENIYMNAAIFGMNKKQIDKKINEILDFAELGEFINSPVRTYSSGMYMRLAFSVAINVDADILLIDEILAVGDESFQKKCFGKLEQFKASGITTVIVSHDLVSIQKLCDQVIWLQEGTIKNIGSALDVIHTYRNAVAEADHKRIANEHVAALDNETQSQEITSTQSERWGNKIIEIIDTSLLNIQGEPRYSFECGKPCIIKIRGISHRDIDDLVFGVGIFRQDNICCYGTNTYIDRFPVNKIVKGQVISIKFTIDKLNLIPGEYFLDVAAHDHYGTPYDYQTRKVKISVYSDYLEAGICRIDHKWEVEYD